MHIYTKFYSDISNCHSHTREARQDMYDWNANGVKPQVKMDAPESQYLTNISSDDNVKPMECNGFTFLLRTYSITNILSFICCKKNLGCCKVCISNSCSRKMKDKRMMKNSILTLLSLMLFSIWLKHTGSDMT